MSGPPEIELFFGRLHPLLIHLPIGLLVLLALLECLSRFSRFKSANASSGFILAVAAPMSVFSAVCGWLLSQGGGYQASLLQWHKWSGIATAGCCLMAGLAYSAGLRQFYRGVLALTIMTLIVASHFGGSLTHGSDYLVHYAPAPLKRLFGGKTSSVAATTITTTNFLEMNIFADLVQPILRQDCIGCHGAEKAESGLRLDSIEGLTKGGKSGPAIQSSNSLASDLIKRMKLPVQEKAHMPPEGKAQPTAEEITLMQWWIDKGAPASATLAEMHPPARILRPLQTRFVPSLAETKKIAPKSVNQIQPIMTKLADELGMEISLLSPSEPWIQCNARIAGANFSNTDLAKLAPIGANVRWLDLAGTKVDNAGLANLKAMPNLARLHLEGTSVTDAGLGALVCLPDLEYLDLYGTEITDAGMNSLRMLPSLKRVYLWKTKVSKEAAADLAYALTDKDQVQQWQTEIEQLKLKVKQERISVELGAPGEAITATNSPATNAPPKGE